MATASPKPGRRRPPGRRPADLTHLYPARLVVFPMAAEQAAVDLPLGTPHDARRIPKQVFEKALITLLDFIGDGLAPHDVDSPFIELHLPRLHRGVALWTVASHWEIDHFLSFMYRLNRD